jgi:polar amino acid transport system substrate-binding protein
MRRRTMVGGLLWTARLLFEQGARAQSVLPDVASSLAPTGRVRVAINYGNAVLAQRNPETGKLSGVSVDIAEELGRRLGLPLTLVPFDAAGKVSAVATKDIWDVALSGGRSRTAREITFTAAYVVINGTYAVRKDSPFNTLDQVDSDGVRIAVSGKSIYDLFLSRTLKHAKILRASSPLEAAALFLSERLEVCAGVQTAMQQLIASGPSLRMIPEPFMQINQAMGTPPGRTAAAYLKAFVESIKAGRFRRQSIGAQRPGRCDGRATRLVRLLEIDIDSFIERAAQLGLERLTERAGRLGAAVRFESLHVLPDSKDDEVIGAARVAQYLEGHDAWCLLRIRRQLVEQCV